MADLDLWVGKWKLLPVSVQGFHEYAEAMKIPADLLQKVNEARQNMTVEIKRGKGDNYLTTIRDSGYGTLETTHFKLGEWFTVEQGGVEVKNILTLRDGKMMGEHELKGKTSTSLHWLDGNRMYMKTTGNCRTTKAVYQRV